MRHDVNYTMLTDFYELTMGNGYFQTGLKDRVCYFDVFFRSVPDGGGFAIAAGLEQVIEYIQNLRFDEKDIAYLRSRNCFSEEFLSYLKGFRFTGDIWAVPEGTPVFPREPILTVRAPAIQAQFVETYLLLALNHQSLIATKSNRIVRAAEGRPVSEFGSRRAQGSDGAVLGARASYIAGAGGTACAMADELFGTPATGTMAHSWVQMFPDEYTAFKTYCEVYPNAATLLVDTYNVLRSGVPNAIRVFQELGITSVDRVDVCFYPQINEFRGWRSVQLLLCDLRPARTRAQAEEELFCRLMSGEELTPAEAQSLLPSRQEFANLWRYLRDRKGGDMEDTPQRLAKSVAKTCGLRESFMRTQVCLAVFHDRGLIHMEQTADHLRIKVREDGEKVDLEQAQLMRRLRAFLEDETI